MKYMLDTNTCIFLMKNRHEVVERFRENGRLGISIAAHARAANLILATNNTREFSRVAGLEIEDWTSTK